MWYLLPANTTFAFDRQDTLRGSNGSGRSWWDVQFYDLFVSFDTAHQSISGVNDIRAKVVTTADDSLQLDLQELMFMDSVVMDGRHLEFVKEGNVWWVTAPFHGMKPGNAFTLTVYYHGKPKTAVNPPWDGGFIWTKDSTGNPWIAVACQGLGASVWWPCKDYQGDEPDSGMILRFDPFVSADLRPDGIGIVANGQFCDEDTIKVEEPITGVKKTIRVRDVNYWKIRNPINSYDVTFYIGDYVHWTDTLMGEKGKLDLSFYVLHYNEARAREQFKVVKQMLHCFEYWMGPYPFYEDGYKLVEAPYLGMEHQSAIAYGNKYKMGYLGRDRSKSGVGLLFDYIIIHESGHEWFGNNITAKDIADNWLHEGFTTYAEALFAECAFGKEKAFDFTTGEWGNIQNDRPVIGTYGVNDDGSSDKYDKGAAVVHMIRMIMGDDEQFRQLLRGMNQTFYHKTVTNEEVLQYINRFTGYDYTSLFRQYLYTKQIPELEWYAKKKKKQLFFRFKNVVDGFTLPIPITDSEGDQEVIRPTSEWQSIKWTHGFDVLFSRNFLVRISS